MKRHPSGRPIHRPERRDYSMQAHQTIGFRCPALNERSADNLDMKGRER